MAVIELSHVVEAGMQTYPGLPGPVICDFVSREASRAKYAPGTEFQIGKIEVVANTGTYVDSPFHRYASGVDLAGLRIEQLADLDTVDLRRNRFAQHRRNGGRVAGDDVNLLVAPIGQKSKAQERGIQVAYSTLARVIKPWREELAARARPTVRVETPPGQQM